MRPAARWAIVCVLASAAAIGVAAPATGQTPARARAQQPPDDRPFRRFEASVGAGLFGGSGLGSADASLRANDTTARPFRLFASESRFGPAPLLEARGAYAFTRRVTTEGVFVFARPELRTSVSDDVEGAPALAIVERIDQYLVEGTIVIMLDELGLGRRTVPFASFGVGYVRQLHEGLTLIEQGHSYHLGGGLKHWLTARDRGRIRASGVRVDARLYLMSDGVSFEDGPRPLGAISGGFFVAF